jgi:hypothetical protein
MRSRTLRIAALAVAMAACLGCSGVNVGAIIHENDVYSRWNAAFFSLLFLLSALLWHSSKRHGIYPSLMLGLLILHPAWWLGTGSGDCGNEKADYSFDLSVLSVLTITVQCLHLAIPKIRWTAVSVVLALLAVPVLIIASRPDPMPRLIDVALLDAAAAGDLPKVKSLLARGAKIEAHRRSNPPTKWEPLQDAWTWLRCPNYPFQFGYTPLMLACIGGHRSTVTFLLERGADANAAESKVGPSSLSLAVEYEHFALIPLLLRHGADRRDLPPTYRRDLEGAK